MNIRVNEGFRIAKCAWQILEDTLQVLLTIEKSCMVIYWDIGD